jgi:hypothetical protein
MTRLGVASLALFSRKLVVTYVAVDGVRVHLRAINLAEMMRSAAPEAGKINTAPGQGSRRVA